MVTDWLKCTVADIASKGRNAIVGGPFGSELVSSDYVPTGVPVIRGANMGNRWVGGEFAFVSRGKSENLAANHAVAGDLVFTQRGTLGQVALVPEGPYKRYLISQSQMKLTVDSTKASALFLYYLFRSPAQQNYIRSNAIQTGVPHTNLGLLKSTPILLPPLDAQHSIARLLGSLDDKIELNRKMNETLEAMARALFKSWFVDFDPVRAKAAGRSPAGMDAETAKLFPSEFVDSPLGPIPKGWHSAPLGHWVDVLSGGTPSKSQPSLWGGSLKWISPKAMTSIHADECDDYVSEAAVGNGTRIAPRGSTLVMVRGMGLHEGVRVSQAREDLTFNQDVKALVPKAIDSNLLLFAMLDAQTELHKRVETSGHGTGKLPSELLLSHRVVMPPRETQASLARQFALLNDRLAVSRNECRTLRELRDELLPRLLSGELSVTGEVDVGVARP
jgi:type I restriction enzyme S subunit